MNLCLLAPLSLPCQGKPPFSFYGPFLFLLPLNLVAPETHLGFFSAFLWRFPTWAGALPATPWVPLLSHPYSEPTVPTPSPKDQSRRPSNSPSQPRTGNRDTVPLTREDRRLYFWHTIHSLAPALIFNQLNTDSGRRGILPACVLIRNASLAAAHTHQLSPVLIEDIHPGGVSETLGGESSQCLGCKKPLRREKLWNTGPFLLKSLFFTLRVFASHWGLWVASPPQGSLLWFGDIR